MTEGFKEYAPAEVIEVLKGYSTSRYFTGNAQGVFAAAVKLLAEAYDRPVFNHAVREGDYAVDHFGVEVQTSRPIVEGDLLTVYVEADGKVWARPDAEFQERFRPKA